MELLSSVIEKFGKCLWDPLKRHTEYLLFYRQNINKLETQVEELDKTRDDFQQDVDAALWRGETVRNNVQQWLDNVNTLKSETEIMVARLADTKCWKGWCWNLVRCHGLGKEAAKKMLVVDDLRSKSNFERVSHPPPPPTVESLLPTSGFQAFASIEMPMKSVLNALQDEEIQIIGVYGMGGVGKTTMMKEVAKKVAREKLFNEVVMVTISQDVIIEKIQQEIGVRLALKFEDKDDVSVRAAKLLERLKQVGKFLIILDDMWIRLELNSIGIPYGEDDKGCKIVITTRRLQVCNTMKSQVKIEVAALSEDDSWNLFEKSAGSVVNSPKLFDVARNVVKECKGLPLAIVVLGRALTDEHDAKVWNDVLNSLKQSIPTDIEGLEKEVFHSIKFSFDYLRSNKAKLCFLFCCLFPEDYDINYKEVTWHLVGEGKIENVETLREAANQVHVLLNNLKASGLLLKSDRKRHVKIHDIVRDVAVWIASDMTYGFYSRAGAGLKEWPRSVKMGEHQRISLMQNDIRALPEEPLSFPKLRTLLLNDNKNLSRIPDGFFSKMKALEVLNLSETRISSLPTSISCLTNLRALNLSICKSLENLSGIEKLKSLEILNLSDMGQVISPIRLEELSNLRYLRLADTHCKIPRNVISQLLSLEELQIFKGFDEWQVQGSDDASCALFAELADLSRLRRLFINVRDERCFSEDLGPDAFENLVNFWIVPSGYQIPENQKENWFAIFTSAVPNWAKLLLPKTDNLLLRRCPGMKCLFGAEGVSVPSTAFSNIKRMRLAKMTELREVCGGAPPNGDMPLTSLRSLEVKRCEKLTSLFSWKQAQRLECLEELYVSKCPDMVAIIMSEKGNSEEGAIRDNTSVLLQLRELELRDLKITGFDTGGALFDWPSLETLTIVNCPNLKRLPLSPNGGLKLWCIVGSEEWFQALEWDDESIRSRLQTVFIPIDDDNEKKEKEEKEEEEEKKCL